MRDMDRPFLLFNLKESRFITEPRCPKKKNEKQIFSWDILYKERPKMLSLLDDMPILDCFDAKQSLIHAHEIFPFLNFSNFVPKIILIMDKVFHFNMKVS